MLYDKAGAVSRVPYPTVIPAQAGIQRDEKLRHATYSRVRYAHVLFHAVASGIPLHEVVDFNDEPAALKEAYGIKQLETTECAPPSRGVRGLLK